MNNQRTITYIRGMLGAIGYYSEDTLERVFDALIDLHHKQGAENVRLYARLVGLSFADKPYKGTPHETQRPHR